MNRDDIIKMAREADLDWHKHWGDDESNRLERFAAFVAAAERKRIESRPWGAGKEWIARAVEAEREACAQLCLETEPFYGVMFAEVIRARGEK